MTISKELWDSNLDLAESSYASGFVKGIRNGDLPISNFKAYIAQDAYFLEAFANAYRIAIKKNCTRELIVTLTNMLSGVNEELRLHRSYTKKWGVNNNSIVINLSTKSYTDFLYEVTKSGDMIEIISAMTPCMRLYSYIGKKIKKEIEIKSNPYKDWILTYSNEDFENLAKSHEKIIDDYFIKKKLKTLQSLYSKAMKLELIFFNAYSP
tara:strand:+ start:349 stop:975 length:627 start_codon:yes stop_codon:yes gene_type:complete